MFKEKVQTVEQDKMVIKAIKGFTKNKVVKVEKSDEELIVSVNLEKTNYQYPILNTA